MSHVRKNGLPAYKKEFVFNDLSITPKHSLLTSRDTSRHPPVPAVVYISSGFC